VTEAPFDEGDRFRVTLKAGTGYDAPWITISAATAADLHASMEKGDGADLLLLMQTVSGAAKAFNATFNNKEVPAKGTQGRPTAVTSPSKEVGQDPFKPEEGDDAPPFAESAPPTPSCKHGERIEKKYKGKTFWVCPSDLPKGDPNRCAAIES
jgi:hypothetical protein